MPWKMSYTSCFNVKTSYSGLNISNVRAKTHAPRTLEICTPKDEGFVLKHEV